MKDELRRAYRFALAGSLGFAVDAGVLLLVIAALGPYWGRALSFLAAVVATWLLNRRYAFADRTSGRHPLIEFVSYLAAMLAGGVVNYGVYAAIVALAGSAGVVPYLGVAAGSLVGMAVNLALARLVVFRHGRDKG